MPQITQPTGMLRARSPINIAVWDNEDGLERVQLDIYIWTGAVGSRPASAQYNVDRSVFANDVGRFDVAPFVRDYLSTVADKVYTQEVDSAEIGQVVWVSIDYTITYTVGSITGNIDSGTLDTFFASDGYALFEEGVNVASTEGFLTPDTTTKVGAADSIVLPLNLGVYQEGLDSVAGYEARVLADGGELEPNRACYNIGLETIRYINAEGNTYDETADLAGTSAADRVRLIPAGVVNASNWLNANSFTDELPDQTASYQIQLLSGLGEVLDSRTFEYECEVKYDVFQLAYLNKYGIWDYMSFFKASRENLSVEQDTFKRSVGSVTGSGYSYNSFDRQYQQYNKRAKKSFVLNTGWVDEGNREKIEEMLLSENVLILSYRRAVTTGSGDTFRIVQEIDDEIIQELGGFINLEATEITGLYDLTQVPYAVNITDSSYELKQSVNDKVINYTVNIEFAFDYNQF